MGRIAWTIAVVTIVCGAIGCGDSPSGPNGGKSFEDFSADLRVNNRIVIGSCELRDTVWLDIEGPISNAGSYPQRIIVQGRTRIESLRMGIEGQTYTLRLLDGPGGDTLAEKSIEWQPKPPDCPVSDCTPVHGIDCP